ncbi:type I restriction endonuclease [Shewanella sp.]|jgi:hypothetical protein|uniref:type I restriction endonuclease n=1 Tax=Shewanella sp. TaxID=50422 RepID=UPI003D0D9AC3
MEFIEKLEQIAKRIPAISANLTTEEATKNALIMPFLNQVLGYDIFNPLEVVPEFTADTPNKRNEKVDYALMIDGKVQVLIECKRFGEQLAIKHAGQLFRYFSTTNARIAILTNGVEYQFFTDIDAPNKMDEKPFLKLDLLNIDKHVISGIAKLTKESFDLDSIVNTAGDYKYLSQIKKLIEEQVKNPDDDFVRFFASRLYDGAITAKVKQQFSELTIKAFSQFINDSINARLKTALHNDEAKPDGSNAEIDEDENKIITTEEEIEGFNIVKAILRQKLDVARIVSRDQQSYFGILLDDNNRKPLCRLHFNTKQKYIGTFDENKKETRHPIESLDDLFKFADQLLATAAHYVA